MKVGIVTLLGNNYGGMLQAYALKRKIEELNLETLNINYAMNSRTANLKNGLKDIIYYRRNVKFEKFKKENFNLSNQIKNIKEINEEELNCDIFVAGSDQIWNQQIPMEQRKVYYLDFAKKAKRISYAASVGRDEIEEEEKEQIGKFLDKFDYISIREKTGVRLYQPLTKNKIENVLDPTLLLTSKEWNQIAKEPKIKEDYIFSYTLGADKKVIENIDKISKKLNLGIVEIYYKKNFSNEIKNINDAGPKEFVGLVKNSKYVITNSFHGMVFSILYKKDFWVFKRGKMNSRIYDLLEILNLQDRIIDTEKTDDINLKAKIDYDKVYSILEEEKQKSLNFLKHALNIKE